MTETKKEINPERKDKLMKRLYGLMFGIALIFGIPAAFAVVIGTKLDAASGGRAWTLVLLLVAFLLSWIVFIALYRKLSREAKEADREYKEARKNQAQTMDEVDNSLKG